MKELQVLLDSDLRFACIKMFPVTTDPNLKKNSSKVPANAVPVKTAAVPEGKQLLTNKTALQNIFYAVSRISNDFNLASPESFTAAKPSNWDLDFQFCRDRKADLRQIAFLLRMLRDGGADPATSEYKLKEKELLQLLDSDPHFQCIKMNPVSSNLAKVKIQQQRQTSKKTSPPVLKKTSVPQQPKTTTARKKPTSVKTTKGIHYDPQIRLETGMAAVSGVTSFSKNANHIRIYIDEAWPHTLDKEYSDVGVISGIVWIGTKPNYPQLPHIETHLRTRAVSVFRSAVSRLLQCDQAFPFLFPIFKTNVQEKDYPELLRIALITLLGWILPQDGKECDVKIFCEGITASAMEPGKNYADGLKEMCNTMGLTTGRMARWHISEFISMKSEDKEFEYIPYADAVGYLTIPTIKARNRGKLFQVEDWPGYVPMSRDLLLRLVHLDSDSPAGYADELFEFARDRQKTKLFFYVLDQAVKKAEADPKFKEALFEKLEKMFEDKERDLPLLNHLCKELSKRFPLDSYEGCPRQKLIRILVELQNANHIGDPEKAMGCIELYSEDRKALLKHDFGLCAYTDMNLAVHYNDQFDFSSAAAICRDWENQPGFESLNMENQGRILSSIGQSYSLAGDYEQAKKYFLRAIEVFNDPDDPLPDQADQTGVYLALNELDAGNYTEAKTLAEKVFQCSFTGAVKKYAGNTDKPFHHHLLVKNLYFNPEVRSVRKEYLSHKTEWTSEEQHPWELVELYRILLLHEAGDRTGVRKRFDELSNLYQSLGNGGIILLLKAFALTVCRIICGTAADELPELLAAVEEKLPATAPCCKQLSEYLERGKTDAAFWKLIPFNYK